MQFSAGNQDPLAGHERYQTKEYLGQGATGFVLQALDKRTNENVAIKLLKRAFCTKYVESEIINHSMLRHPQVVQLKGLFLTPEYVCIVMELATLGNLFDYVVARKRLPETVARFMFQQLMLAVDHCHQRGVVNRDLKLDNTLLHPMPGWPLPLLKLCDFGYSKADHHSAPKSRVGTLTYMAPEVLDNAGHSQYDGKLADIWSCGVMLYAMLYGSFPYDIRGTPAADTPRALEELVKRQLLFPESVEVSQGCRDLLRCMLHKDPSRRATVEQILANPWFLTSLPPNAIVQNVQYLRHAVHCTTTAAMDHIRNILASVRARRFQPVEEDMDDEDDGHQLATHDAGSSVGSPQNHSTDNETVFKYSSSVTDTDTPN